MKKILYEFLTVFIILISVLLINSSGIKSNNKSVPEEIKKEISYQRSDKFKKKTPIFKNNLKKSTRKSFKKSSIGKKIDKYNERKYVDLKSAKPVYVKTEKGRINLNVATLNDLIKIKGVGNTTAKYILKFRKEKGAFLSIDELLLIEGIGRTKLNKIKAYNK